MIPQQVEITKAVEHNKKMAIISKEKQSTNWFVGSDKHHESLC